MCSLLDRSEEHPHAALIKQAFRWIRNGFSVTRSLTMPPPAYNPSQPNERQNVADLW